MSKLGKFLSELLDNLSEYLATRKGLLPLLGTLLVLLNLILEIILPELYITRIDLFLHLGLVLAVFGLVVARAL